MMHNDELTQQRQLKQLMKDTRPSLSNALSSLLPRSDIDDVLQETYFIWFQKHQEQHIENSKAYVFRVARNLAISRLRNAKIRQAYQQDTALHDDVSVHSLSTKLAQSQTEALLSEAIASLPPLCKQVFILRKLHGKTHHEISHTFGISVKTIENHITKGMHHCRRFITKQIAAQEKKQHEL